MLFIRSRASMKPDQSLPLGKCKSTYKNNMLRTWRSFEWYQR